MGVYIRILLLMLSDFVAFLGVFFFVAGSFLLIGGQYQIQLYLNMWPVGIGFIIINELSRLYHGTLFYPGATFGPSEELRRICYSVTSVFCGLLLFLFISKSTDQYSRFVFVVSWPLCILAVVLLRWVLRSIFKRFDFGNVRAVILGAGDTGKKTARLLLKNKYLGIVPVGFLDDSASLSEQHVEDVPVLGKIDELKDLSKEFKADYIIVCLPVDVLMETIKTQCQDFKHIMIIPTGSMFSAVWVYAYDIGGILGLEMRCNLMLKNLLLIKKITDYCLALAIFILSFPVLLICGFLVKITSPGPVIYRARRIGVNGKKFRVYKFRTMKDNADHLLEQHFEDNPHARKEWQEKFKLKNDPRLTSIGAFLRKTSLDELPQIFNILRGQMSLIGPRPIVQDEVEYYGDKYELVSSIKPGVTGLWQVSGRSELRYDERVELDCYYLMNWSIWLDLFILLKTVKEVLFCRGAY